MELTKTFTVSSSDTANALQSGGLEVLSTPRLAAWMENVAYELLQQGLESGQTSVGISISLAHKKASAVGEMITCQAVVTASEARASTFEIVAKNAQNEEIGTAQHQRVTVDAARFMEKLANK